MEVGSGWNGFHQLFGTMEGTIYALTTDGRVLWYEHETWKTGGEIRTSELGDPLSVTPVSYWQGPVVVAEGLARYSQMLGVMPKPLPPGGGVREVLMAASAF